MTGYQARALLMLSVTPSGPPHDRDRFRRRAFMRLQVRTRRAMLTPTSTTAAAVVIRRPDEGGLQLTPAGRLAVAALRALRRW
jgi:hypothetical protein